MFFCVHIFCRVNGLFDWKWATDECFIFGTFFNLVDKYPPLCLLKGYVEKAKRTVMEISQKSMTRQSLREVIIKEIDNLRMAQDLAKQCITDSGLRTGIMAEIHVLLRKFGKKKRSLADASTALTSNPQQQKTESSKKRKKEQAQDHHMGQENQQERQQSKPEELTSNPQQQKTESSKKRKKEQEQDHHMGQENQQERQQSKPGEKLEEKQKKPQQEQQQKNQNKPQKEQQQKQEDKLQGQQKWPRRRTAKLPALTSPAAWTVLLRGNSGHPPCAAMQGVHHAYPAQPGWPGVQGVHHAYPAQPGWPGVHCAPPFTPQLGAPEYIGPFDPFYHRPQFYPW
ncbi:hypothetical protein PVAP13_9NG220700 [Panicum virgatum]|uniref:FRIGIDA-like protein n=1 Tax=Panicum virgatum TaxID=38727 RepID=A0A8T0MJ34_PANVG|nr:hypothetical protein PVAP13_9NG220700 [Panicum virgatum]